MYSFLEWLPGKFKKFFLVNVSTMISIYGLKYNYTDFEMDLRTIIEIAIKKAYSEEACMCKWKSHEYFNTIISLVSPYSHHKDILRCILEKSSIFM